MPGAVRPDDPDPLAALGGEERGARDALGLGRRRAVGRDGAAAGQIADDEILDPDDDLAGADGPPPASAAPGRRSLRGALRRLDALRLEALEARLVLVHLAELAVAAVALDELLLARDRLGLGVGVLGRARVALDALAVVGAVVAAERRQPPVAKLPDPGHGRVEEGPVVGGDEQRAARRRRCSSSHSRAAMSRWFVGSSRSSRSGSAITRRASAARVCSPPDSAAGGFGPLVRG